MITEEGIVVKKGLRWWLVPAKLIACLPGAEDLIPKPKWYWAKIKVSGVKKFFNIKSKYNFQKGTSVRIKYDKNNYNNCELIIDWE